MEELHMINITYRCDKYGDHTAHQDDLCDVQTKRFEQDEEFEAAAFVDECTETVQIYSELDLLGILRLKQDSEIEELHRALFEEEEEL